MLWLPTARPVVLQAAVRALPLPVSGVAVQPAMGVAPSLKLTLPVGALPVTVAVNVTALPRLLGVADVASAVALATAMACAIVTAAGSDVGAVAAIGRDDVVDSGRKRRGRACGSARIAGASQRHGAASGRARSRRR